MITTCPFSSQRKHLFLIVLLGISLRIAGLFNEPWLDEIWSIKYASSGIKNLFELLTWDNLHPLTTVLMAAIGPSQNWFLYRIPSLLAGIASLFILINLFKEDRFSNPFVLAVLWSFSFLLVLYDSEARGYGFLTLAVLLSITLLTRIHSSNAVQSTIFFWLTALFGLFSHYLFITAFFAFVFWSAYKVVRKTFSFKAFVLAYSFPLLLFAVFSLTILPALPPGSGPIGSRAVILINTLSLAIGGFELSVNAPNLFPLVLCCAAVTFFFSLAEIYALWKEKDDRWVLFFAGIFICPALFIAIAAPRTIMARYFLPSIVLFYILFSRFLVRRKLCRIFIPLFICLNGIYLFDFVRFGRGEYRTMLNSLADNSADKAFVLEADQALRAETALSFYLNKDESLKVLPLESGAPWRLYHSQDRFFAPKFSIKSETGIQYTLIKETHFASQSGWRWFLYRRTE
jgi:hypothetical protein